MTTTPPALPPELAQKMDAYWTAANYLPVGQAYLPDDLTTEKWKQYHKNNADWYKSRS